MTMTYTYAVLEVSPAAHAEIKAKLLAAGYQHAIDGDTIDMHGIALEPEGMHGRRTHGNCAVPCFAHSAVRPARTVVP